jgi:hypothetical protein
MGRLLKAAVLVLGLVAFGFGSWIVGTACFLYLLLSSRSKSGFSTCVGSVGTFIGKRTAISLVLAFLVLVAFASGGIYSPVVFLSSALLVYLWPLLSKALGLSRVAPVEDSTLMRSRFLPVEWHTMAEVKPGSDDIPRALSSFAGMLVVAEGRVFTHSTVFAINFRSAQRSADAKLRDASASISEGGAFLLPLDSKTACDILRWKLDPLKSNSTTFQGPGAKVVSIESQGSYVRRMRVYSTVNASRTNPTLPSVGKAPKRDLLLWDVLQSIGKTHSWQEPDSYSSLLESINATKKELISRRLNGINSSAETITIQSLGGDDLPLSRAQLRAIMALYS